MKVLFAAAEAAPLVRVGGLAEVIGSLPRTLNKLGHDVRVILPCYGAIDTSRLSCTTVMDGIEVPAAPTDKSISVQYTQPLPGLQVYLIDNPVFSTSRSVYGDDDLPRFLFFCHAVTEILKKLDWKPDIVHCHDWHAGLIPMLLKAEGNNCPSIFTIHNLAYQGNFDFEFLVQSGLQDWWQRPANAPEPPLCFMGQGILWADFITTVSKTYAAEILTPEYGAGLDNLLRYRQDKLSGIINGLNYEEYNPETDDFIPDKYGVDTIGNKRNNKHALQKEAGFNEDDKIPLLGMVTRLDEQKGIDILEAGLERLFSTCKCQLVILGQGRDEYQHLLSRAASRYSDQLAVFIDYDERMGHLVYAGCDMFLMPSRYEPCGLGQLIAMRYGTVPIVRHTGGLVDTVQDLTPDLKRGSGFVFQEYSTEAMMSAIQRALGSFQNNAWEQVVERIMALDFSWQSSAVKYESLYRKVMG